MNYDEWAELRLEEERKKAEDMYGPNYTYTKPERTFPSWDEVITGKDLKEKAAIYRDPRIKDPVNNPLHYNKHGVECITAIQASMSDEEFKGYLKGNTIKYLWRYKYKEKPKEDLQKAQWYLSKLEDVV